MASSTIDLLLKTKADTSGISQIKSAIQSTNQELVLMGGRASHGSKGLNNVNTVGKETSGTLAVLATSLTLVGNSIGGVFGRSIASAGTRISQLKSAFDALKALCPAVLTSIKGVGAAFAGATAAAGAMAVGVAVGVGKLISAMNDASAAKKRLDWTYKEGYIPYSSAEQHEGYLRRWESYKNSSDTDPDERLRQATQYYGIRTNNRNEFTDRYEEWKANRLGEYQQKIDATDMALARETDDRKKLILERQRVELQAEQEVRRAKDAEMAVDDGASMAEKVRAKLDLAHAERSLALEQVRSAEMLKRFDDEKIKRDEERVRLANEAAEAEARAAEEKRSQEEKERRANEIRKTTTEKILSLEKEITNAKEQADNWNRNADAARGQSFGDWARSQRDAETAKRTEDNQRDKRISRAVAEYNRLRDMNPKTMGQWNRNRLAQLSEYLGYQSGNNPHLKTLEEKEQERDNLQKSMDEHLKNLDEAISGNVALKD